MSNWTECAWSILHELRREAMTSPRDTRLLKLLLTAESALEHIHPPIRAADDDLISYPVYVIGDRIVRTVTTFTKFFNVDPSCPEQLRVMSFFPRDREAEVFFEELANGAPRPLDR